MKQKIWISICHAAALTADELALLLHMVEETLLTWVHPQTCRLPARQTSCRITGAS
jgi:hypothetical protein